jgi:hypothetical protein
VYERRLTENLLDALAHQLPVNLRRRLVKTAKVVMSDTGLAAYLQNLESLIGS